MRPTTSATLYVLLLGLESVGCARQLTSNPQWSNFEIGSLEWLRSKSYIDYFSSLDQDGGFFYERWGDAPVHSIAAATMLKREQIHFFNEIAYYHVPFTHCPSDEQTRLDLRCHCKPEENFDWKAYSCKHQTASAFDKNSVLMKFRH